MNVALKKSFCVIQLICMTTSVHADWMTELKDILKICAIAGTSVLIYAKWFGQAKLTGNSSSAIGSSVTSEEMENLKSELKDLRTTVAELNLKKDDREESETETNSVHDRQNQEDVLSSSGVEELISNKVASGYERLFLVMNKCSNELIELGKKQVEFENIIKHHVEIIGDSFENRTLTDQQPDTQVKPFEEYLTCNSSEAQKEIGCSTCFQTLKDEVRKLKALVGDGFNQDGKIISFVQFCALLKNTILKLCEKMDYLNAKTDELGTSLTVTMADSIFVK